jgi:prephenate dehydratase
VHNLIALPGAKLGDVRRVFSHPVALDQCRDLFARNPKLEPVPFYDTAGSVKHVVAEGLRDAAAIASRRAAEVYAGKILKAGIEDDKKNFTRFFLIERGRIEQGKIKRGKPRSARNADKTSLAFSLKNIPGALFKALSVFALRDISLSKIESRPMRGRPWEYVFFVDLLRGDDEDSRHALRHLSEVAELVKVLGIYPEA